MNILFLAKYFYPHIGGVEKHVEMVSRELIKKGHQVTVLTFQHDSKLPILETHSGIKIIRIPYLTSKWGIWKNIWQKKSLFQSADIIHCHDIFFWYLPFRFIFPAKPVFTTFHGWEGKFPIPKKNKFLRKIYETLSCANICIGEYLKIWYSTKPNFISYGGVTQSKSKPGKSKSLNQITFIGRLDNDTGTSQYLKAIKVIKSKHNLKITFVGSGPYKKQAQKIGTVTGMVKDISPYLNKPSYIFASSYLTILEAMNHQRPVFSLYQNQLKKDYLSLFPGSKYIRISDSSETLVKQFNNAVKYPKKIDKLVTQAHNFSKTQTWEKVTNLYLKLWKKN